MDKMIATISEHLKNYTKIEDEELFRYGLSSLIKYVFFFIILIPIGIYLNILKESCIFLILFIIIRIHVGGYHLNHALTCLIVSVTLISIIPYLFKHYPVASFINYIIFFIGTIFLIIYAPVANDNKKISSSELMYFKQRIKIILLLYLLLFLLFELIIHSNLATIISLSIFINALNVLIELIKKGEYKYAKNDN